MVKKKKPAYKKPGVKSQKLDQWKKQGFLLARAKNVNQWAIADWMCAGVGDFKKPYAEAAAVTGMTVKTLRQFCHTASKVLTRVNGLSFGHHRLVAEYKPAEQKQLLKHAKDCGESVASFAAFLRDRKNNAARRANTHSHADQAADKVLDACNAFLRNSSFDTLLSDPPTPTKRNELIDKLKAAVAQLNGRMESMTKVWREHEKADEAFLERVSSRDKAQGAAVGK